MQSCTPPARCRMASMPPGWLCTHALASAGPGRIASAQPRTMAAELKTKLEGLRAAKADLEEDAPLGGACPDYKLAIKNRRVLKGHFA